MLTKRIIPCLDVDAGRVVKGTSFVNLRDAGDPADLAAFYDREGGDELVFLDITASADSRNTMVDVVQRVSEQVFIPLTVGGGIRTLEDMRRMLNAGADKVSVNTSAITNPDLIGAGATQFGSQCIVVAIDAKRVSAKSEVKATSSPDNVDPSLALDEGSCWEVYTHGGRTPTGIDAVKWAIQAVGRGSGEILPHQHGRRRPTGRLRPGADRCHLRFRAGAGHRQRRCRQPGAPVRRPGPGPGRRSAGRLHFPLRHVQHRPGQGIPGFQRNTGTPHSSLKFRPC